jgi:hypothetical protein
MATSKDVLVSNLGSHEKSRDTREPANETHVLIRPRLLESCGQRQFFEVPLCESLALLENKWIARITELMAQGKTCNDSECDYASGNLSAIADEFFIWEQE